jgi:GTP-binding protein
MEIQSAEFVTSLADYREEPPITLAQIAVAGRSNVGKSTLINALCNRKKLCKTSASPGKTRLINVFEINGEFHLVDLPGYGFAKVDKAEKQRWAAMMERYFRESTLLAHTLHLVDIRHEPTADDVTMNRYLRETGASFTVVATKADQISRGARGRYLAPICRALLVQPWEVIPFSSVTGAGREELLSKIETILHPALSAGADCGTISADTAGAGPDKL